MLGLMTNQTCGEACWQAREDVCRCQCGGHNHGVLRTKDGTRPPRTRRIGRHRYQLTAVITEKGEGMSPYQFCQALGRERGYDRYLCGLRSLTAKTYGEQPQILGHQPVTEAQMQWAELTAYRGWDKLAPGECWRDAELRRPIMIWERLS